MGTVDRLGHNHIVRVTLVDYKLLSQPHFWARPVLMFLIYCPPPWTVPMDRYVGNSGMELRPKTFQGMCLGNLGRRASLELMETLAKGPITLVHSENPTSEKKVWFY